jgi:hypothetical protein
MKALPSTGISIAYERELIPVATVMPVLVPDQAWRHVDAAGHGHFWSGKELPTLEWVITGTEWAGDERDGEEVEVGEYRCRLCDDEVVEPGRRTEAQPQFIPSLTAVVVTVNGDEFRLTPEQYQASVQEWIRAMQGARPSDD